MRRGAKGCDGCRAWRANTKHSTRSCGRAFEPSAKGRAPVTQQKPKAIPVFQASCVERLQQAIPSANTRPVRVLSQDERRFGRLTIRWQRLTARGVQPVGAVQHVFEWCYVYGAVEPTTGDRFFLELPYVNTERLPLFVDAFAQAFPARACYALCTISATKRVSNRMANARK
jgi:hypothetical protein